MSSTGRHVRQRHNGVRTRNTHSSSGFDPRVSGEPMSLARDGEQRQALDVAPRAVRTTHFDPSAAAPQVNNSPEAPDEATVYVDPTGLHVLDGAVFIEDAGGNAVLSAAGFGGSWSDFLASGIYNNRFAYGSDISLTGGQSDAVSIPYWSLENEAAAGVGSFARVTSGAETWLAATALTTHAIDQISGTATAHDPATGTAARIPVVGGQRYRLSLSTLVQAAASKPATISILIRFYDAAGTQFDSHLEDLVFTAAETDWTLHKAWLPVFPEDAVAIGLELTMGYTAGQTAASEIRLRSIYLNQSATEWTHLPDQSVVDGEVLADSFSVPSGKLARFVPVEPFYALSFAPHTGDVAKTALTLSSLPTTGVVAVQALLMLRPGAANTSFATLYNYGGTEYAAIVYGKASVFVYETIAAMIATGGTNNRQIQYALGAYSSGTGFIAVKITGYWTTE